MTFTLPVKGQQLSKAARRSKNTLVWLHKHLSVNGNVYCSCHSGALHLKHSRFMVNNFPNRNMKTRFSQLEIHTDQGLAVLDITSAYWISACVMLFTDGLALWAVAHIKLSVWCSSHCYSFWGFGRSLLSCSHFIQSLIHHTLPSLCTWLILSWIASAFSISCFWAAIICTDVMKVIVCPTRLIGYRCLAHKLPP